MLIKDIPRAKFKKLPYYQSRWQLQGTYAICLGGDDLIHPVVIRVDDGYVTDGASIPWCFRWLLNSESLGLEAPLLHDKIIDCNGGVLDGDGNPIQITRADADEIFRLAMVASGIPQWRAVVAYVGVRVWAMLNRLEFK